MGVLWKALVLVHFFKLAGKTVNNDAIDPVLKFTLILKCRLEVPLLFLTSSNIIFAFVDLIYSDLAILRSQACF